MKPAISLLLIFATFIALSECATDDLQKLDGQDVIILVAHGEDPENSRNRVIIPQAKDGQQSPIPCLVSGGGIFEHGQTFTRGNFHYNCRNGTAEVIACIAEDMSVIQIGRTFLRNGVRHRCQVNGNTVLYEQRSSCFENGIHYDIGETFRNGSFKVVCKEDGVAVLGCYLLNSTDESVILLGESRIVDRKRHNCELSESGKIRYVISLLSCQSQNGTEEYEPGQIWTDRHIRYQCTEDGAKRVLGGTWIGENGLNSRETGCIDEAGLFIELGHDILMGGTVHRCYKVHNTTYYHRFECDKERSLTECIHSTYVPKRKKRTPMIRKH